MPIVSCNHATHCVIGTGIHGESGVLNWFDEELGAHREAKQINKNGGYCWVEPVNNLNEICKKATEMVLAPFGGDECG